MHFLDPEELKPKLREVFETVVIHQIKKAKMKQTAVEWLVEKLEIFATEEEMNIIEQAKAMEKEQMCECYSEGLYQNINSDTLLPFEQYYNKTFKSE